MTLITSCGSRVETTRENPLLQNEWDTPFGIAPFENIVAEDYLEAFDLAIEEQRANIEYIVNDSSEPTFESVIWALDNADTRFRDLKDLFEMSEAAISDESYRAVSQQLAPRIAAATDSVWMDERLFNKVALLYDKRDQLPLEADQRRLLERVYTRFVRGGAELDPAQKARLAQINGEIATLCATFSQNLLAENDGFYLSLNRSQLEGIPNNIREIALAEGESRGQKGSWIFTLNPASMIPFLSYSSERELREEIYKAYLQRGANGNENDNREIVRRVTELRQERAKMLGYKNHADYVISQQMAGSVEAAYELLESLWEPALKSAKSERDELQKLLRKDLPEAKLESWDWWFYAEKLRDNKYKLTNTSLEPYLSLSAVRGGLFSIANRLYGLVFRPVVAPIYSDDCEVYEVLDRQNQHLGVLYFDLYPRSGKGQGAWCGNLREQRVDGGYRITPVVAVVCNLPRPTNNNPSLLTISEVETLFHEFGHALHFLFQDVDYRGLASVEGDFVEFPSQVMENWAMDREALVTYATHHKTGEVISSTLIERIEKSRLFNQGYETLSVVAAALLDLDLQTTTEFEGFDIESFERESLRDRRGLIAEIEPRYHLTNFAHLFTYDYSAGYYFYLWAEVLDKDCFAAFKQSRSIFTKSLADKLHDEILVRGGEEDGATLYRNFRGANPSQEHLLRARGLSN